MPAIDTRTSIVVTTISAPNQVLKAIADGCLTRKYSFWVIGDAASPPDFTLAGCRFLNIENQLETGFRFARKCPLRHYARKNIGYLSAIAEGVDVLIETDDDNRPAAFFWSPRSLTHRCANLQNTGWVNTYRYFTDAVIWPRGFPLDRTKVLPPPLDTLPESELLCPIQQGLTNGNPDVDAIYRLLFPLPLEFQSAPPIAISRGAWCPFNSQNTSWFSPAFPLLYLPAHCSFRSTDIWRSLIAQRICWENGWSVLFHAANGFQDRNDHDLMRDFADEVPIYSNVRRVAQTLESLPLRTGIEAIPENLVQCYESLAAIGIFDPQEIPLVESWLFDLEKLRECRRAAKAGSGAISH